MDAHKDVAVSVHLEKIPVGRVEPEAAHRETRIVLKL